MSRARPALLLVSSLGAAILVASAFSEPGDRRAGQYRPCYDPNQRATIVAGVIRYCGPATARLSVFAGVRFGNGLCFYLGENFVASVIIELGSRGVNRKTNNGFRYIRIHLSARPGLNEANVLAYSKGRRWRGKVVSRYYARPNPSAGTFVAHGRQGSRGRATGSFSC